MEVFTRESPMDWRSRHRRELFSDKKRLGEIFRRVGAIASREPDSSEYDSYEYTTEAERIFGWYATF